MLKTESIHLPVPVHQEPPTTMKPVLSVQTVPLTVPHAPKTQEIVTLVPKEELTLQLVTVQMVNMVNNTKPNVTNVPTNVLPVLTTLTIVLFVLKTELVNQNVLAHSLMDIMKFQVNLTAHLVDTDALPVPPNTNVSLVPKEELTHQSVTAQKVNSKMPT